jgi:Zn finger protein HypA/HybF involved in hydrogenase expression
MNYDQLFRNRAEESHSEGADEETKSVSTLFRCEYGEETYTSTHLEACPRCSEPVRIMPYEEDLRL